MIQSFSEYLKSSYLDASSQSLEDLHNHAKVWFADFIEQYTQMMRKFHDDFSLPILYRGNAAKAPKRTQIYKDFS